MREFKVEVRMNNSECSGVEGEVEGCLALLTLLLMRTVHIDTCWGT